MSTMNSIAPTLENVLQLIRLLPRPEIERLREILGDTLQKASPGTSRPRDKRVDPIIPNADFSLSVKWLTQHSAEYAGQWVALDGDRLVAHGHDAGEVYAAAEAAGVKYPMVTQAEDPNAPPFAGF
ncbi:MAG TPA: DUF5678 domain-containing protein [Blastocatellia bacterium]|nr:DUF5678 domain-containing protein [Blastocatellia bacterium]HMX24136.1 DUF5678 domain-containing protein [Blastocatellia bacterium]HMY75056.1 DUF5678 domain-containing protein [Blastocatellia bacterium]HNG30771.1 DUF5678 domain-containing protein [Blastocatellia bacterium]